MVGLVIRNTGSSFQVKTSDGNVYDCIVKGNFRIKGIKSTNPVAVGDRVSFDLMTDGMGWITEIEERRNYIVRRPANLSKQLHVIAANLDQLLLIVTVNHPETSTVFLDRVLSTSEAYRVPAKLIFNKIDLYDEDEQAYLSGLVNLYESIGYECLCVSAQTGENIDRLRTLMQGKISLLSGNSGVGKSSIVNAIAPDFAVRVGEVSQVHNKGMHTTTFSEMFEIAENTYIIDTPGIKGFGTFNFEREEVGHFFPDIFHHAAECRFNNCTHTKEPGCAVLKAVESHYISQSRYASYLSILEDCEEGKYR